MSSSPGVVKLLLVSACEQARERLALVSNLALRAFTSKIRVELSA